MAQQKKIKNHIKADHILKNFWKEAFWSQSFCLLTAGGAPVKVIRQYIETQGEKKYQSDLCEAGRRCGCEF